MAAVINRHRFTEDDYFRMAETGILSPDDRVELIDGQVVVMSPIGPRHGAGVDRAAPTFIRALGDRAIVRVQGSVRLDRFSHPQPDLVLLRPRDDFYASDHPGPQDILLVIEVAQSSLAYDRDIKAPVYARMGVPEYWLADLKAGALTVYTVPLDGRYRSVRTCDRGARLAPHLLPDVTIPVEVLLP